MPLPPFLNSSSCRCLKGNCSKGLILGFFIVVFIGTLIWQTRERVNPEGEALLSSSDVNLKDPLAGDKTLLKNLSKPSNFGYDEPGGGEENVWCQARDYVDLSEDPVFSRFQEWTQAFIDYSCDETDRCDIHDPRVLRSLIKHGETLSKSRAPIFEQIIRGDPSRAIELAIPADTQEKLPLSVRKNLENWESAFVDIQSMHVCFDPQHPVGFIKTFSKFEDGRTLRTWSFGARKKLTKHKGLAVWGVSVGEDFAMAEQPVQILPKTADSGVLKLGGNDITYDNLAERRLLVHEIKETERRYAGIIGSVHQLKYPIALASSMSADAILTAKYELNATFVTYEEALSAAMARNGYLLQIKDAKENLLVRDWLKEKNDDVILPEGFDESNNSVPYVWLGATDNEDTNGTIFDTENNLTTQTRDINASEGNWKWLTGEEWSYENWKWDTSANATKDFAALDWEETNGSWVDINETARLPFIIEFDNNLAQLESDLRGIRKVLVVPARFIDETIYYKSVLGGDNFLLTNDLDEEILKELQTDAYEPISRETVEQAMATVREYFSRNTDGELDLIPVITPTVTMIGSPLEAPFTRYYHNSQILGESHYDSEGNFSGKLEIDTHQELPDDPEKNSIEVLAMTAAANASEDWYYEGFAFISMSSITVTNGSIDTNFSSPPTVEIVGGEANSTDNLPHPRFKAAEVEVVLDGDGDVIGTKIIEPGAYYFPGATPQILLNGVDYTDEFTTSIESILISKVALTNYSAGAPGIGWVGAPGAHVRITNGNLDVGTLAHEIGHNFGLWHSNQYVPRSEHVLSDDADIIEYGNPFSVMGRGKDIATSGDLSSAEKVRLNIFFEGGGGYSLGNSVGDDVADLSSQAILSTSALIEEDSTVDNTLRIYRSNYGSPPRFLLASNFTVRIPDAETNFLLNLNGSPYELSFLGSGSEAEGQLTVSEGSSLLTISKGGRGFVEEPMVQVLDENNSVILTLDPSWIRMGNGRDFEQTASLLSYSPNDRWIRGVRISASNGVVRPYNINEEGLMGARLDDYYLTFRTDFSERGVMMEVANDHNEVKGNLEPFLLDATPQTPQNFDDAALLIGATYSDYDSDVHITPVGKGGNEPMPYIEVVVNMGTVESGDAQAPSFEIFASTTNPESEDLVQLGAMVTDGNTTRYAYSWFVNEQALTEDKYLNKPSIDYKFSDPGRNVVRVTVSDMKGGLASRNIVIVVQGDEATNQSMIAGTVRSSQGSVQGARVVIEKAPIIEHNVSLHGSIFDSFYPDGMNNPAQYQIDGSIAPQLIFRRGEIHRFIFDKSVHGVPMTFLVEPEVTPPRIHVNMLSDPRADIARGSKYLRNPDIEYLFRTAYSTYLSTGVGTYLEMLEFLFDHLNGAVANLDDDNGTILELISHLDQMSMDSFDNENLITRPFAKALMQETNVSVARVGPMAINEIGYFTFGGQGYNPQNTPTVEVRRSSIWEDYSKRDAIATAFVDGVGTISPVNTDEFLGKDWVTRPGDTIIPDLRVWGSGGGDDKDPYDEANASIISWTDNAGRTMRTIKMLNQGKGFEPNSTMAVLHYPVNPVGYFTFDRHETLFEDSTEARHIPSPGWNREHDAPKLSHYWKFDSNESDEIKADKGSNLIYSSTIDPDDFSWGLLGKSFKLSGESLSLAGVLEDNCTFSIWVKPETNFALTLGGQNLTYASGSSEYTFGSSLAAKIANYWTHLAVVSEDNSTTLYVDGRSDSGSTISDADLLITANVGETVWLDEGRVYSKSMTPGEILYLAGRVALDISGNKRHASPMGSSAYFETPNTTISSTDAPTDEKVLSSPNGSGRLGDSYPSENHGLSLKLDGEDQFLDLYPHASEYPLFEGTFSIWIKPNTQQDVAPLLTMAIPYSAALKEEENATEYEISEAGSIFSFELTNGWPKMAGSRAYLPNDKVKTGEWSHLVGVFSDSGNQLWLNGRRLSVQSSQSQTEDRFAELTNLLDLSADAELFSAGKSYSRTDDPLTSSPSEIFFNGLVDDLSIYDRVLTNAEIQYLYELRRGREQIPRLEAVVDAVGTVTVNEGGEGYRENPDLVFWYGADKEFENNLTTFTSMADADSHYKDPSGDYNGSLGEFILIDSSEDSERGVWSFHQGKDPGRSYNWSKINEDNGWRRHISAQGYVEYENASLGDVVWTKKMDSPTELPMPDGRMVYRSFIDYVSMDINNSYFIERNQSSSSPYKFYKPNGLYGFIEKVDLNVSSPYQVEENGTVTILDDFKAEAFVYFYIDADANESITVVDTGLGINSIPVDQLKVSGPGYQPETPFQAQEDHGDFAKIDTDTSAQGRISGLGADFLTTYDWNGSHDLNISTMEFNQTYGSVSVENQGFGYAMPVEFKVIGGQPVMIDGLLMSPVPEYNSTTDYVFEEAEFEIISVEENGSIADINITNMGQGYVNYANLQADDLKLLDPLLNAKGYKLTEYPLIMISGGGGRGASFRAVVDDNGSITDATLISGGSGYVNTITGNFPRAIHTPSLSPEEKNATLAVKLGGYLKEIPRCTACQAGAPAGHDKASTSAPFSHLEPWIEIWDRGRSESDIDSSGSRAHAAPKVVNGKIEKVVITQSGAGYIDPVAIVRDAPPKHMSYWTTGDNYSRKWKCTYMRLTEDGHKIECGHIQPGLYPPEYCPGETDNILPYEDENGSLWPTTGDDIVEWMKRHNDAHKTCAESGNPTHLNARFLVRKCWGTKMNYILDDNAIYRNGLQEWAHFDANLTVITDKGKIREIVVDNPGANYYGSSLYVEGSGAGVDAIPVFDEYGHNTRVIFDDPRIKNIEIDLVDRPSGAGQGFRERPWAWDEIARKDDGAVMEQNDPHFGTSERIRVRTLHPRLDGLWNFGDPNLADYLGDRVQKVEILDPGYYAADTNLTEVTIAYDSSTTPDFNRDGLPDFVAAELIGHGGSRLTHFLFDNNGSYEDNTTGVTIERGLFYENPKIQILDKRNLTGGGLGNLGYDSETLSNYIRLNDKVDYDPEADRSFIELYVDDRFPDQLYYGVGVNTGSDQVLPTFGGEILVMESIPGYTWANNEASYKPRYSYADQDGFYAFSNLEPGLYNIAVFLEDQKFQESTFRPDANPTRISQMVYVPGFAELTMETDSYGLAKSTLVWSRDSRNRSVPEANGLKTIQGIGRGFTPGSSPELTFIPHPDNIGQARPNVSVSVSIDGSLTLTILDDQNTSKYYPSDRFSVRYSSVISGIDFLESFLYSETNQTFNSGVLASWDYDGTQTDRDRYLAAPKLVLTPDDANGTNLVEVHRSTQSTGEQPLTISAKVYEANGSIHEIISANMQWSLSFDFNASEGNNTRVALLDDGAGSRELNATGNEVNLLLFSSLRSQSGRIKGLELLSIGEGYEQFDSLSMEGNGYGFIGQINSVNGAGAITGIEMSSSGFNHHRDDNIAIETTAGTGAVILSQMYSGRLTLDVNYTLPNNDVLFESLVVFPSLRNQLNKREQWMDKYLDTFFEKNASWWGLDDDNDTLTNEEEFKWGTHPGSSDTDGDGLHDVVETTDSYSNPLLVDTDGDGLEDGHEKLHSLTNPRLRDTDRDGLNDSVDPNATNPSGNAVLSGRLVHSSYHADGKMWFSFNGDPYQDSWYGFPKSFYFENLVLDENYTLSAFIDLNDNDIFEEGEPIDELNITLNADTYGLKLIPVDSAPVLEFYDPADSDETVSYEDSFSKVVIDVKSTEQTTSFAWTAKATDLLIENPWYVDSFLENNGSTPVAGQRIMVDGNFTEYIDQNFSGSAKILDLANTPWGFYELGFTAVDDHENLSSRLVQTIEIRDAQAPFLTLLETYVSEGIKPRVFTTESNETIDRVIAQQDLASHVIYYALSSDANWTWPLGIPFIIDGDDATLLVNIRDNKDGEIDDLNFTHSFGSEGNFTNNTGTFDLEFYAQDNAGNEMNVTLALEVVAELETEVTGIDGYLQGAEVIFDANGDGISDLSRIFRTDENGRETISFSRAELKAIDTNGNGRLDASEGRFIIRGGIDTSTGTQFHGVLQADANSSVVSPLTSLVQAIMDQNVSKSDALTMVREAFGLSDEIDLTTYDPFAQFAEENATSVLVANLRVANIINQAEGLLRAINGDYQDSEISTKILSEIGSIITKSTANFDLQESFANVIPQALQESKAALDLDSMDHLLFVQYISQADAELASDSFNLQLLSSEAKEDFQTADFDIFVQMDLWESEFAETNPIDALQKFTFSINLDPSMGKVWITDQLSEETFPYDTEQTFNYGQIIELNASANQGYQFKQWQDGNKQTGIKLVINQDMHLVAKFEPVEYDLQISSSEGGVSTGTGTYKFGDKVPIVATPYDHYEFDQWIGEEVDDPYSESTHIIVSSDHFIQAKFNKKVYTLSLVTQSGEGTLSGFGNYDYNSSVTITANPAEGYEFDTWTGYPFSQANLPETEVLLHQDLLLTASFKLKSYELSILVNGNGKAVGAGKYEHGSNQVVFAEASPDHEFLGWWEEGELVHAGEVYGFTNLRARTLESRFGLKQHILDLKVGTGGSVQGGGSYAHGSLVKISAEANEGYEFMRWSGLGHEGGEEASMEILVDGDISLVAELNGQLSLSAGEGGQVSGAGSYPLGSTAIISAKADAGYLFNGWIGAGVLNASHSSTEVDMSEAREITASFVEKPVEIYSLAVESVPFVGGTTQVTQFGNEVTVVATAATGYKFSGWSGAGLDGRTEKSVSFSLTTDTELQALFEEQIKQVSLLSGPGGSVTGGGEYKYGLFVEIVAEADAGYRFVEWTGAGLSSPDLSKQTIRVTQDLSLEARFEELPEEKRTLSVSSSIGGSTLGGGSYVKGSVVDVIAEAEQGYEFIEWTGEGLLGESNASTIQVDLSESRSLTASFKRKQVSLSLLSEEGGNVLGAGIFEFGSKVSIAAIPISGYTFEMWSGNGIEAVSEVKSAYVTLLLTEDSTLTAQFVPNSHLLQLEATHGGTVLGAGEYTHGKDANIMAIPSKGYQFIGWKGEGVENELTSASSVKMLKPRYILAEFRPFLYKVSTSVNSTEWGHILGAGDYHYGQTATLIASPASGYKFDRWEGLGLNEVNSSVAKVLVMGDLSISAHFSIDSNHWKNILSSVTPSNVPNPLFLESTDLGNSWHHSNWLGTYFSKDSGWVYHSSLGWLYVHSDGQKGYWFWDVHWGAWWWTTEEFYPWVYRNDLFNWVYLDHAQKNVRYFDLNTQNWKFRK